MFIRKRLHIFLKLVPLRSLYCLAVLITWSYIVIIIYFTPKLFQIRIKLQLKLLVRRLVFLWLGASRRRDSWFDWALRLNRLQILLERAYCSKSSTKRVLRLSLRRGRISLWVDLVLIYGFLQSFINTGRTHSPWRTLLALDRLWLPHGGQKISILVWFGVRAAELLLLLVG